MQYPSCIRDSSTCFSFLGIDFFEPLLKPKELGLSFRYLSLKCFHLNTCKVVSTTQKQKGPSKFLLLLGDGSLELIQVILITGFNLSYFCILLLQFLHDHFIFLLKCWDYLVGCRRYAFKYPGVLLQTSQICNRNVIINLPSQVT